MKLFLLYSIFCCFVFILIAFVNGRPHPEDTAEPRIRNSEKPTTGDPPNLELAVEVLSQEVFGLVGEVPGLEGVAEVGEEIVRKAGDLWMDFLNFVRSFRDQHEPIVFMLAEKGHVLVEHGIKKIVELTKKVERAVIGALRSTISTAKQITHQIIGGIDTMHEASQSFRQSLHKINGSLHEIAPEPSPLAE